MLPALWQADFEEKKSREQIRKTAEENWPLWRLILSDAGFDYETVFYRMTWDEILEANVALDLQMEAIEKKRAEERAKREMNHKSGRR